MKKKRTKKVKKPSPYAEEIRKIMVGINNK